MRVLKRKSSITKMEKYFITSFFVVFVMMSVVFAQNINLTNGLVAHYAFEGNANDSTGNGFDGTENAGVQYAAGIDGQAAQFDGIDDYISINGKQASHFGVSGSNPRTIAFWIFRQENQPGSIFALGSEATASLWAFVGGTSTGDSTFWRVNGFGTPFDIDFNYNVPDQVWTHFVITYDGDTEKVFINGTLFVEKAMNLTTGDDFDLWIGDVQYGVSENWHGKIDELGIWNRVLNDDEITVLACNDNEIPATNVVSVNSNIVNIMFIDNCMIQSIEVKARNNAITSFQVDGNEINQGETQSFSSNSLTASLTGSQGGHISVVIKDYALNKSVWVYEFLQ